MSVNLNNWLGNSKWGYNKLKGCFYLERLLRVLENWVRLRSHTSPSFSPACELQKPWFCPILPCRQLLGNKWYWQTSSEPPEGTNRSPLLWIFQDEWILPVYYGQFLIFENLFLTLCLKLESGLQPLQPLPRSFNLRVLCAGSTSGTGLSYSYRGERKSPISNAKLYSRRQIKMQRKIMMMIKMMVRANYWTLDSLSATWHI